MSIEAMKLAKTWFERNTYGDEAVEEYEALVQSIEQVEQEQPVAVKQAIAIAIQKLYEDHPADVLQTFTTLELHTVVEVTDPLRTDGTRVEHVYKKAWDQLASPPPRQPLFRDFIKWAGAQGYDCAQTCNSDTGEWVCLNPMTADLWKAWQAAHGIKENT